MYKESNIPSSALVPVAARRLFIAGLIIALVSLASGYILRGCVAPEPVPAPSAGDHVDHTPAAEESPEVWTCSMHPNIRMPGPGKCPICGMDLIPVRKMESMGAGVNLRTFTTSTEGKELMEVRTSPVERRFVTTAIRMVGKVDYDETRLGYITAWVPGRLDRLYVDYTGVNVSKGDHMVYLYSPEILTAQEELRRAAAAVANMRPDAPDVLKQTAKTTLEASRSKLLRWGLTEEQVRQAETQKSVSDHITIYAPMGGTVIQRMGQEGMYVETGTMIYTIADLSEVWIMLEAYESDLPWIHYGQGVEFTTEAFPGETFHGKIAFIDPMLDKMTRTVKVRVNVPNQDGRLKPEMFVRAVVRSQIATGGRVMDPGLAGKWICPMHPEVVKSKPGACDICGMALVKAETLGYVPAEATPEDMPLVIPASAVLITGKRAIVYVEVPGTDRPTYEGREITLGARAGDYYIVRSGLREGELVVTNGNFKIDSSLQIQAKPSMMTPDGGAAPQEEQEPPLPNTLMEQLEAVFAAQNAVRDTVNVKERDVIATALKTMQDSVADVEITRFPPEAHAVWMEYSMRLKNDILELGEATNQKDQALALAKMDDTIDRLRTRLGLKSESESRRRPLAPAAFRGQLKAVTDAYLAVQQALAKDNVDEARMAARQMREAVTAVDATALDEPSRADWAKTDQPELINTLSVLEKAGDIETVRKHFQTLSLFLRRDLEKYGLPDGEVLYMIHCPMAFDNTGADWLQRGQEVRNPYYGNAMPDCGVVQGRIGVTEDAAPAMSSRDPRVPHEGSSHE